MYLWNCKQYFDKASRALPVTTNRVTGIPFFFFNYIFSLFFCIRFLESFLQLMVMNQVKLWLKGLHAGLEKKGHRNMLKFYFYSWENICCPQSIVHTCFVLLQAICILILELANWWFRSKTSYYLRRLNIKVQMHITTLKKT